MTVVYLPLQLLKLLMLGLTPKCEHIKLHVLAWKHAKRHNPHQNNSIFLDTSLVSMLRYVDGHEMAMGFGLSAASINGDVIHSVL